jgi:putative transposase
MQSGWAATSANNGVPSANELLYWAGTQFTTRAEAEAALLRYIDGWYNLRRIQEGLGGLSPDEYEEEWQRQNQSATTHPEQEPSR